MYLWRSIRWNRLAAVAEILISGTALQSVSEVLQESGDDRRRQPPMAEFDPLRSFAEVADGPLTEIVA